ncbi:MAG: bifunctional oligoribonuclease/PAP phosphatase NrnA, partial [Akkermansiaceae bacterium]|nr:bifunctional oligoribonuclease/PAP phosphatase NrnA [Akkermansiaceae bacterium]
MGKEATLEELAAVFGDYHRIALVSHMRPDGDAIGSVVAMKAVLEELGKEVVALNEDPVPENLTFLEGADGIQRPDAPVDADVVVALDTANKARLGKRCLEVLAEVPRWVNIDHHVSNEFYGDLVFIDEEAAAVGEIVYGLIMEFGWPLPPAARDALYVAVSTDTGSFQYSNTRAATHEMVSDLLGRGLDAGSLSTLIYHNYPFRRVELLRELLQTLEHSDDGRVAWWTLTEEVKDRLGVKPGDSEGLIDVLRAIRGVVAVVFFEEVEDGMVRVSTRSKDPRVDVCKICAEFGGGGHVMASGARLP